MWNHTFHRFTDKAAFIAACDGNSINADDPPYDVAFDVIGAIAGHTGFHVNAAWYNRDMPAAFSAAQVSPDTPVRRWV